MGDRFRPDAALRAITTSDERVVADLTRVKALFQARTIAAILDVPPPNPETFASETNKDWTAREDLICPNCEGGTDEPGENCGMCARWLSGREP